tara:strand:- start:505 stop:891 length:387 start_codon:yes stop_codon:yes gene_type:complete
MICLASIEHIRPQAKKCKLKSCQREYDRVKALARYHTKKHEPKFKAERQALAETPTARYNKHFHSANARGIEFKLTFAEWWNLWKPYWDERGKSMCMCRTGDTGAYEINNVRIDTYSNNALEANNHKY